MSSTAASGRRESELAWALECLDNVTDELERATPSEWAEAKRYLPPSVTSMPGYYRFAVAPYLKEPLDCLSLDSPIRELAIMKGVQVCFTVGVLENAIGYDIDHVKTAPVMFVTADAELANLRVTSNILPMLQHSKLEHLIKSSDEGNGRKTGKTRQKIEWVGGGYLVPFGAQNANKLRSVSICRLYRDEIDGWPDTVGRDGDPIKLTTDRTAAYEDIRKIVDGSTPLIAGQSKIEQRFKRGDQRKYFVCCLACGHPQELRWKREDPDTGEVSGIVWETDPETKQLIPGSVRYLCEKCGHAHTNDDKTRLLDPEHGAEWRPTATPVAPHVRSYHISALYSPVGMQTWEECVRKWLDAWDVENSKPRDLGALQVFYNNVLGMPYVLHGERLKFEQVSPHRRQAYTFGNVPNQWAAKYAQGPVAALLCSVDVHKDWLAVGVFGFTRGRRSFLVDYWRLEGDTEQLDDPGTWGRLREILEGRHYIADDGKRYRIALTLVDSGYRPDQVYQFCGSYSSGVIGIKGRDIPTKNTSFRHFSQIQAPMGALVFAITVDVYKDRLSASLKHEWDGLSVLPEGQFSAPMDATDAQLKELTVEVKREKISPTTKQRIGWEWHRPGGSRNELWDLSVYAMAGLDMLAFNTCPPDEKAGSYLVDWGQFFDLCESQQLFFTDG